MWPVTVKRNGSCILPKNPGGARHTIAAVAIDMWEPYINAVEEMLPEADIVHDKFHIAKYLGEAVDKVRKAEHQGPLKEGSEDLKGTKYLWLTNRRTGPMNRNSNSRN